MSRSLPEPCVDSSAVSASFRPSGVLVPLVTPFDERGAVDLGALEAAGGARARRRRRRASSRWRPPASRRRSTTASAPRSWPRAPRYAPAARPCSSSGRGRTTPARRSPATRRSPTCPASRPRWRSCRTTCGPSEAAIVRHFQAVAERSPVPLIVYNIPYRTGRGLGAPALIELAATPNIAGREAGRGLHRRRHAPRARRGGRPLRGARRRRRVPVPARADGRRRRDRRVGATSAPASSAR